MIVFPPSPNIGGDVSPLSHRDRRPWNKVKYDDDDSTRNGLGPSERN